MIHWIIGLAIAAQLSPTIPTQASKSAGPTGEISPAMTIAIANKLRARVPPSFINEPEYKRPDAARAAGEFGEVVLHGIVGEDGKLYEPTIKVSSRSKVIDGAALAAVPEMLFQPARDSEGKAISLPINVSLEYSHVNFHGTPSLAEYRCDQFTRDYDWWYRTWPNEQDRIFKTLKGFVALSDLQSGNAGRTDFGAEWKDAIESCRAAPNKLMVDMLKPHGRLIRGMAGR